MALLGFFLITLNAAVVNVALSTIRGDLGGGMLASMLRPSSAVVSTIR